MPLRTDPIDWRIDPETKDLDITTDLVWTTGPEAVVQGIRIALSMIKGEWFADLEEGVPYLERDGVDPQTVLLGRKFNPERARAAMRPEILKVPGVKSIISLDPSFDNATRTLTVRFVVDTVFGDTVSDTLSRSITGA